MLTKIKEKLYCKKGSIGGYALFCGFMGIAFLIILMSPNKIWGKVGETQQVGTELNFEINTMNTLKSTHDIALSVSKELLENKISSNSKEYQNQTLIQLQNTNLKINDILINIKRIKSSFPSLKDQLEAKNKEFELLNKTIAECINILSSPNLTKEQLEAVEKNKQEIALLSSKISSEFSELYKTAIRDNLYKI